MLVGFLAQVVQVPHENRVLGLLYFEGDELLVWTVLYLLNLLNHINRPRLLQFRTTIIKRYRRLVIQNDHVGHGQSANRFPIKVLLLVLNQPQRQAFGFKKGEGVFVDEHDFEPIDAEVTDLRVVFVDNFQGGKVVQHKFSRGFADQVLVVVYRDYLVA